MDKIKTFLNERILNIWTIGGLPFLVAGISSLILYKTGIVAFIGRSAEDILAILEIALLPLGIVSVILGVYLLIKKGIAID